MPEIHKRPTTIQGSNVVSGRQSRITTIPVSIWVPALFVGCVMALPIVYLLIRSVSATDQAWAILFRLRTLEIILRTISLVVTVTLTSIIISLPLAWLTVRTDLPYKRVFAVLTAIPLVIPSYVGAFLLISVLGPKGLIQQFLEGPLGIDRFPSVYGLAGATATLSLLSYPYVLLIVRGVLRNIDPSLEESARSLGYGPWRVMFKVVLPQLRPALAAGSLLVGFYVLSDFGAVSLLRYETFTWAIYQQYTTAFDRSIGAVLSLMLVGISMIVLVLEGYSNRRIKYHRAGSGAKGIPKLVELGRWKWIATGFCLGILFFALLLPVSVLGYWFVRGIMNGEAIQPLFAAISNSVIVSVLTAGLAMIGSVPVAVLLVRYPSTFSKIIEKLSYSGYVLPGVVVALSLVFFGVNLVQPIYQTIFLLIVAYIVLFFPIAIGATRAALEQVRPGLEEASRGLGNSQVRTILAITIPLVGTGIMSGGALVFLVTMKELPATLILGPLGFSTLATEIWATSSEAFFAKAAVPALLLMFLSSIPMAFLVRHDRRLEL